MDLKQIIANWLGSHPKFFNMYECDWPEYDSAGTEIGAIYGKSVRIRWTSIIDIEPDRIWIKMWQKYLEASDPQFFQKLEEYLHSRESEYYL